MIMSRHPNSGQNQNIRIVKSFGSVATFKLLGTTLTNPNDIHDEIKSRSNSGNVRHYSVPSILSSRVISKNPKIKIYKTVILPAVLYGCGTWSHTLTNTDRDFPRIVCRRTLGPKMEADWSWRKLHSNELHSLYSSPNIARVTKARRLL
jgi:hypothetical protein